LGTQDADISPEKMRLHVSAIHICDASEIDVWRGSLDEGHLDAVLCTVDVLKRDAELKLLVGCSLTEKHAARDFHTGEHMSAILVEREAT